MENVGMGADKQGELKTVYQTSNYFEAHIIRGILETNDIKCVITGTPMSYYLDAVRLFGLPEINIKVLARDAEAAIKAIKESEEP